MVHGDPPAVTVSGRVVANGVAIDGKAGRARVAAVLRAGPRRQPRRSERHHAAQRGGPGQRRDVRGRAAAQPELPGPALRLRPARRRAPTSFAVAAADAPIGDVTMAASAELKVNVESAPGVLATFAELVLIPYDDPAATGAPAAQRLQPVPGLRADAGSARRRPPQPATGRCEPTGSSTCTAPPGHYYVYATRGPFASIDSARGRP